MFSKEVGIDLGTANLLMYVKGEGIVIDEPSVVAIDAETKKCLAAGQDAKDMLGRTPGRVLAIRPLKDGVIADFEVTEIMLNFFFKKLAIKGMFKRPTILICLSLIHIFELKRGNNEVLHTIISQKPWVD